MSLVSRSACVLGNVPDLPTVSTLGLYAHAVSEINMVMVVIVLVNVFVIGSSLLDLFVFRAGQHQCLGYWLYSSVCVASAPSVIITRDRNWVNPTW